MRNAACLQGSSWHDIRRYKTDNRDLFDFALEEIKESSFELLLSTFDLHADDELMKDNIMTEYEERFSSMGNPICKYVIRLSE